MYISTYFYIFTAIFYIFIPIFMYISTYFYIFLLISTYLLLFSTCRALHLLLPASGTTCLGPIPTIVCYFTTVYHKSVVLYNKQIYLRSGRCREEDDLTVLGIFFLGKTGCPLSKQRWYFVLLIILFFMLTFLTFWSENMTFWR